LRACLRTFGDRRFAARNRRPGPPGSDPGDRPDWPQVQGRRI